MKAIKGFYDKNKTAFNYKFYETETTADTFIFWPGAGEGGPLDGSQINKVDAHEYPKLAASGFEFPFNLLVLQGVPNAKSRPVTQDFRAAERGLFWLMDDLKINTAGMGGLSQGGMQAAKYGYKSKDPDNRITHLIWVCGKKPSGTGYEVTAANVKDIPRATAHGNKDTSGNSWYSMNNYFKELRELGLQNDPELFTIEGGGHSAGWTKGLNPKDEIGKHLYERVLQGFKRPDQTVKCLSTLDERNLKATFHLPEGDKSYGLIPDK